MNRPLRNPELTVKALDFIRKNGRNTLDELAKDKTKAELIAEGWIVNKPKPVNGDWL